MEHWNSLRPFSVLYPRILTARIGCGWNWNALSPFSVLYLRILTAKIGCGWSWNALFSVLYLRILTAKIGCGWNWNALSPFSVLFLRILITKQAADGTLEDGTLWLWMDRTRRISCHWNNFWRIFPIFTKDSF